MGKLTCLQSLQFFKVGLEIVNQIEEIGHLKILRGKLTIEGLQLVCCREEAKTTIYKRNQKCTISNMCCLIMNQKNVRPEMIMCWMVFNYILS